MSQNLYEGAVNAFESITTVIVTVPAGDVTATETDLSYAGQLIFSVFLGNDAYSFIGPVKGQIVNSAGDVTVTIPEVSLADSFVTVLLLAPRSI